MAKNKKIIVEHSEDSFDDHTSEEDLEELSSQLSMIKSNSKKFALKTVATGSNQKLFYKAMFKAVSHAKQKQLK